MVKVTIWKKVLRSPIPINVFIYSSYANQNQYLCYTIPYHTTPYYRTNFVVTVLKGILN